MKKHIFKIKKIILTTLITISSLTLTSCGENLKQFARSDLAAVLNTRFEQNRVIVQTLHENGFISDNNCQQLLNNINKQEDTYITKNENGEIICTIEADGEKIKGPILSSIREVKPYNFQTIGTIKNEDGSEFTPGSNTDIMDKIISNCLISKWCWNWTKDAEGNSHTYDYFCNDKWYGVSHSNNILPITIVDTDSKIFENIDAQIYVLNTDIATADGTGGIDGVLNIIKACVNSNGEIINAGKLNNYFSQATYVSDVKDENGNVKHSKNEVVNLRDLINLESLTGTSISYGGETIPEGKNGQKDNRPGYDLLCTQYDKPVLKVAFNEFYSDAVDEFKLAMGIDNNTNKNTYKWLYYHDGNTVRAYLMEYPVYYVKGFQDSVAYGSNYSEAIIEKSDLGINLYTGNTIAYTKENGETVAASVVDNKDVNYLSLDGALNANSASKSAYILSGVAETTLTNDFGMTNSSVSITTGRIILRDYLEATYAPGFNEDEDVVVFGRKLRLTNIIEKEQGFTSSTQNSAGSSGAMTQAEYNENYAYSSTAPGAVSTSNTDKGIKVTKEAIQKVQDDFVSWTQSGNRTTYEIMNYISTHPYITSVTKLYNWYKDNQQCTSDDLISHIKDNFFEVVDHYEEFSSNDINNNSRYELEEIKKIENGTGGSVSNEFEAPYADLPSYQEAIKNGTLPSYTNLTDNPTFITDLTSKNILELNKSQQTISNGSIAVNSKGETFDNFDDFVKASKTGDIQIVKDREHINPSINDFIDPSIKLDTNSTKKTNSIVDLSLDENIPMDNISNRTKKYKNLSQTILIFDKSKTVAIFVDANGDKVENTSNLLITDFCQYGELISGSKIYRPTGKGEAPSSGDARDTTAKSANSLPWESTNTSVTTTLRFPGPNIGQADYAVDKALAINSVSGTENEAANTHQVFYAMTTSADLFSTALFSSWVNVSTEGASMEWWNTWLSNNNYIYHLDPTQLEDYLYNNFKYELSQNGIVILDLETVRKIQEEIDNRSQIKINKLIRTMFLVVGWVLIVYAVLLILAYVIDTNADIGYNLLTILTKGKLVAVKYESDIPPTDAEHRKYVTLSLLLVKCGVIVTAGILLIMLDVFRIVLALIKAFGKFSSILSNIISGLAS